MTNSEDPSPDPRSAAILAAREALHARGLPADDLGEAAALAVHAALEAPKVVYLVTNEDYSDYPVGCVFSTREGARQFVARAGSDDERDIKECVLDGMVLWEMGPAWVCSVDLDDGQVAEEYRRSCDAMRHPTALPGPDFLHTLAGRHLLRVISPISADHARKVAIEKRQEWLRTRDAGA